MSLLVTGAPQALATAAYAAIHDGGTIFVNAEGAPSVLPHQALYNGVTHSIDLQAVSDFQQLADHADPVEAVIVVAESRDLLSIAEQLRPLIAQAPVLLAPGGFAGALRVTHHHPEARVAEATGFPVSGSADGPVMRLGVEKKHLPFAAADESATEELLALFRRWLPHLEASHVRTTSLANTNHIIHPPVTALNAVRIDRGDPFTLYRDGVSNALDRLLEAVDTERIALCEALGADTRSGRDWMCGFYADGGMNGDTLVECLASYPGFEHTPGPGTLDYRYLVDDVPHGIAAWAALGRRLSIPTPHLDRLIGLLTALVPHLDLEPDETALELFWDVASPTQKPIPTPA